MGKLKFCKLCASSTHLYMVHIMVKDIETGEAQGMTIEHLCHECLKYDKITTELVNK